MRERTDEMQGSLEKFARFLETLSEPSLLEDEMAEKFTEEVEAAATVLDSQFPAVAAVVMQENGEQTDQMVEQWCNEPHLHSGRRN